jgi:hypothetical protein
MKRIATALAIAALAVTAAPASADRGAPGTTFPEQPGTNNAQGCAAVATSGAVDAPRSTRAGTIVTGLFLDACPVG